MTTLPALRLALVCLSLGLPACKGGRTKLEQLVPDGATGMASIDAKALLTTDLWTKAKAAIEGAGDQGKIVLNEARDQCELDVEKLESVVIGFDALSQSAMGAVRMPNVGKMEALRCLDDMARKSGGQPLWEVSETDGKATVSIDGGEVQGWAMDSDTLVLSSKGWASAVQARIEGESKGAVDNSLADAVALADRRKHIWFAGKVPALIEPFLEQTPVKGVRRAGGTLHYGDELEIALAMAFADDATAKALGETLEPMIEQFKQIAVLQGLPQKAVDSVKIEVDGEVVRGTIAVPLEPLEEATTKAFTRYLDRSKTSEARVQLARMFDEASVYFNEEHLAAGALEVAPHGCPNDGRPQGQAGVTPPLSVDCSKGPSGRCTPGGEGPGGYDPKLWADNPVWKQMGFEADGPHSFHYDFRWSNDPEGFGRCQFTAQAFGDLDGDGIYSTYERSGAADHNGVNAAAGLYIDREVE